MNSTLPTPRDLPPRSRARIRNELERTVTRGAPRRRHAPLITALAAVAVLGAIVAFVPWKPENVSPPAAAQTPTPPPKSSNVSAPVFPGLSAQEQKAIEEGCSQTASRGPAVLYNLVNDEAGKFGLLYSQDAALECTIGRKTMPYNAGSGSVEDRQWLPGEFAVDVASAAAGGSVPGNKAEYRGERGVQLTVGRVSAKVAKVTYTEGDRTVDAVLANGTFVARIVHSDTWKIPETPGPRVVRAYDANGALLGDTSNPQCHVTPAGTVVGYFPSPPDPKTCLPATRWR
ncbi:hypothetical protein JOF56_007237 [Kibdelosporangium banguiense]|uniref:DUF4232 domain-containing protein n=1 Tax=Kibdelosporangium banguiense TaxID=1365924 RepID=A0ABS4TR08_9PSEU|nr:hypothetical protein [Kibdelosporangium banguiense]MBP2326852.1 hypothetical protein [Kibdelosporangium banguiense]